MRSLSGYSVLMKPIKPEPLRALVYAVLLRRRSCFRTSRTARPATGCFRTSRTARPATGRSVHTHNVTPSTPSTPSTPAAQQQRMQRGRNDMRAALQVHSMTQALSNGLATELLGEGAETSIYKLHVRECLRLMPQACGGSPMPHAAAETMSLMIGDGGCWWWTRIGALHGGEQASNVYGERCRGLSANPGRLRV